MAKYLSQSFMTAFRARQFSTATKATVSLMKPGKIAKPFGPYSFGKLISHPGVGTWAYTAGQLGMTPTGDLISPEPGPQTKLAMENMESLAKANGFEMSDMIKATVFMVDISHGPEVNAEYIKFFEGMDYPARSGIAVH